jgi:hypothetical protein
MLCFTLAVDTAAAENPLAAYVGKYPFDRVNGVAFLAHPAVVAGVRKAVADPAVLRWVLDTETTQVPIAVNGGRMIAHACEPHNCGDHQWAIVLDLASGAIDVCYRDGATLNDGQSRGYLAAGGSTLRAGDCPDG